MALYAFDGTWNYDKPGTKEDTNVMWFVEAYGENHEYIKGIGTKFDKFGAVVGGIMGAGGHPRVKEMMKRFADRHGEGDVVDVIGFSRGAALALDFVNRLAKKYPTVRVRFLGIWDAVPAFGVSLIPWDPTWKLDLPSTVDKCCHALALDERRPDFQLRRPKAKKVGQLTEVWFRGVHSDIGGGNQNGKRSSISLEWMFAHAVKTGMSHLDSGVVAENKARMDAEADISKHAKFWVELGHRQVERKDLVHQSALEVVDDGDRRFVHLAGLGLSVVNDDDELVALSIADIIPDEV